MSIASLLTRLTAARDGIRTSLASKGISAAGHGFEDFPDDIDAIQTGTPITDEPITITQNGVTTTPSGKRYDPITVNVAGESNYRRFTGTFSTAITGSGQFAVLGEDDILRSVAANDNLFVRVTTDVDQTVPYTLISAVAANSTHVIADTTRQYILRMGASALSPNIRAEKLSDDPASVGNIYIADNQLRWWVNSTNYAVRPCNYVAEVMW